MKSSPIITRSNLTSNIIILTKTLSIYLFILKILKMVIQMLLNSDIQKTIVQMILHFQKKINVIMYIIEIFLKVNLNRFI
jgi:hypothetical protein